MNLSQVQLNGIKFYYRTDDKVIGQRIALGKYEKYETALILRQAQDCDVAVDVGANIGYYTLLLAQIAKKVYAFEPDREAFFILKKNVEENNLKNVVLINKAVGSENKKVGIARNKENFGDSRVQTPQTSGQLPLTGELVQMVRLDEVIKEKVDLIKIDVQGYELEVLKGMGKLKASIIFMEIDEKNIKSLKPGYKYIWSINDFAETSWPIWRGIQIKNNNGYTDLWMKNKMELKDYWVMLKNVNYKKLLKGIINSIWRK